jgi:hypothetical protein
MKTIPFSAIAPTDRAALSLMTDELALAFRWDAACILVAVSASEAQRDAMAEVAERSLKQKGWSVSRIKVTPRRYDIPLLIQSTIEKKKTVFYIQELRRSGQGGLPAYHALNLHREYLIYDKIRCIFWVTGRELKKLSRNAPDFWAFRHKVIEFLPPSK